MENEQYDLVFKGELVPGSDLAQVKKNLQLLFRINEAKVEVLFSGKPIPLKKGLSFETANKYRVAMKKAGARVDLIESAPSAASVKPNSEQNADRQIASSSESEAFQTELGAQASKPSEPRKAIVAPEFDLSPSGSDLLSDSEKNPFVEAQIDLSAFSVAEQSGNLVSENEIARMEPLSVDIPEVDVLPAGSDVLKSEERVVLAKVEVDTSSLSVAEAGERLGPEKKASPPAPNVDHIKLAD